MFNPISMPNFMAPRAQSPVSRMSGNVNISGGASQNNPSSSILASIDWSTAPSAAILAAGGTNSPYGILDGWHWADGSGNIGVDTRHFDVTHLAGVAPDGTGMIRGTVPSDWNDAYNACYTALFFTGVGVFGTHRYRNFSQRTLFRHSASPYFFDNGEGKFFYLQIDDVPKFTFNEGNISNQITLTCSNTWTFNSGDGTYTGTFTLSSGTLLVDSLILPLTGNAALLNGFPLLVTAVSGSNITVKSHPQAGNVGQGTPGYNNPPAQNDTFAVFGTLGGAITVGGNSANTMVIEANGQDAWKLGIVNDATTYTPGNPYTIVTDNGTSIASTAASSQRYELNGYRDSRYVISGDPNGYFIGGSNTAEADQLSLPGWLPVMFGENRLMCNNPWNLAQHSNHFYFKDHNNEIYCFEMEVNAEVNPWVIKFYITTPWGAANLSSGTAGTHTSDASLFGGNVMHFHDYLYFHYEYPGAPLTLTSAERSGFRIENGSLIGNTVSTANVGSYLDIGRFDVAAAHMGVGDIY